RPSLMKRLPLLCLVVLASAGVRAEWLTLSGTPGDAASSYVQVEPTSVEVEGSNRLVSLRMSLPEDRTERDGIRFRSFQARAKVDCETRSARYVSATYFGHPDFVGEPVAVRHFEEDDIHPMTLAGARDLVMRTVNAACGVRPKEAREQPRPEGTLLPR
ncbi:surface-adhesin E family protein, partial [Variovorax sp. Varisp62]|uniref:surface-adhesin E family protein n=1 Tax=Variovorax sp. Varisp62 TaxID=3243049 RepID=UPI0039B50E88